jgi:hypothetical protein
MNLYEVSPVTLAVHGGGCDCPACGSNFAHEVKDTEQYWGGDLWQKRMQCGACKWSGGVLMTMNEWVEVDRQLSEAEVLMEGDILELINNGLPAPEDKRPN